MGGRVSFLPNNFCQRVGSEKPRLFFICCSLTRPTSRGKEVVGCEPSSVSTNNFSLNLFGYFSAWAAKGPRICSGGISSGVRELCIKVKEVLCGILVEWSNT